MSMYVSVLHITALCREHNDAVQNQDALELPGNPVKPAMLVYILVVSKNTIYNRQCYLDGLVIFFSCIDLTSFDENIKLVIFLLLMTLFFCWLVCQAKMVSFSYKKLEKSKLVFCSTCTLLPLASV